MGRRRRNHCLCTTADLPNGLRIGNLRLFGYGYLQVTKTLVNHLP